MNRRRATDLKNLTERELLIEHNVKIETLSTFMQDMRDDLGKYCEGFEKKVDWRNFKWFVGLVTTGIICLTGYASTLSDRVSKNTQEIAVHMENK